MTNQTAIGLAHKDRTWAKRLIESEIMRIVTYWDGANLDQIQRQINWQKHWPDKPSVRYTLDRLTKEGVLSRYMLERGWFRQYIYELPARATKKDR